MFKVWMPSACTMSQIASGIRLRPGTTAAMPPFIRASQLANWALP